MSPPFIMLVKPREIRFKRKLQLNCNQIATKLQLNLTLITSCCMQTYYQTWFKVVRSRIKVKHCLSGWSFSEHHLILCVLLKAFDSMIFINFSCHCPLLIERFCIICSLSYKFDHSNKLENTALGADLECLQFSWGRNNILKHSSLYFISWIHSHRKCCDVSASPGQCSHYIQLSM